MSNRLLLVLLVNILLSQHKHTQGMNTLKSLDESSEVSACIEKTLLVQIATDLIKERSLAKNMKLYNELKESKKSLGTGYKKFKRGVIRQAIELSSLDLSSDYWEKNKKLMQHILTKKIVKSSQLSLSLETIKDEVKTLSDEQKMKLFEGFSSPCSLRSLYHAFTLLQKGKHEEIKKALVDHTIMLVQDSMQQKLPSILFILGSVVLWCTHHKFPKRVQEILKPLYQLLAFTVVGSRTF